MDSILYFQQILTHSRLYNVAPLVELALRLEMIFNAAWRSEKTLLDFFICNNFKNGQDLNLEDSFRFSRKEGKEEFCQFLETICTDRSLDIDILLH